MKIPMTRNTRERGVALLMVIVAVAILTLLAVELAYVVGVDRQLGRNLSSGLRAFYLAKSAARFNMWRLRAYMAGQKAFDDNPNNGIFTQDDVDKIWSLPLPSLPFDLGKLNISSADKSQVEKFSKKTTAVGKFFGSIEAEGKKINLNLLSGMKDWGSSEQIQELIRKLVITILEKDYYDDKDFQDAHPDFNAEDAVDAIIDYIDLDQEPRPNQPPEDRAYEEQEPPYKSKNLPLYTLEELRMVRLWEDTLFDRYSDNFTVLPSSFYINVSQVDKNFFDALVRMQERTPNEDDLSKFMSDRSQTPFKDSEDFKKRFEEIFRVKPPPEIKYVIKDRTFYIKAFGESGGITNKQLVAVRMESKPSLQENCDNKPTPTEKQKCEENKTKLSNNPPLDFMRVIYWREDTL